MTELTFENNLPDSKEFRQALAQAMAMTNPIDDLLMLADRLREYEQKYKMVSAKFYAQYQAGTLDEELQHCLEWAALYDLFLKTKRTLEATLMRAALQPQFEPEFEQVV
jgi:hypothetical protein